MLDWAEWCLGLFNSAHGAGKTKASLFFITWFPLTKMELNQRENSHWGHTTEMFVCKRRQTDRNVHKLTLAYTDTHSAPKLLCVGETGLGDRFGELVSMLWVIW